MSSLQVLVDVCGYALTVEGGSPRIRDVDLGELLGYGRARDIKPLIERHLDVLPGISRRDTVSRRGFAEEIVKEYLLDESAALFIAARSETEAGDAVLKRLIDVFIAARRGLLPSGLPNDAVALITERLARIEAALPRHRKRKPPALPPAPKPPPVSAELLDRARVVLRRTPGLCKSTWAERVGGKANRARAAVQKLIDSGEAVPNDLGRVYIRPEPIQ